MESKTFSYFGFAIKSGNLRTGANTISGIKKRVYLIALCRSASENAKSCAEKFAKKFGCPLIESTSRDLSEYVGKENCKIVAITEKQLSEAILKNIGLDFTVLIGREG